MIIKGSSNNDNVSPKEHCEWLLVRCSTSHEAKFLAMLYKTMALGGTISVVSIDEDSIEWISPEWKEKHG